MSEGDAAPGFTPAAPVPAGLPPGDPGPTIMPNPPGYGESSLVNEPALAEPKEHAKQAQEKSAEAKPEAETKPDGEEKPEAKDEPEDEPKKRPPGSQRLRRAMAKMEASFDALERENIELKKLLVPKDNPQGQAGVDRAPTEADFPNDYAAYDRALSRWEARQDRLRERAEEKTAELQSKAKLAREEFNTERVEAYEEYADVVRERIPDFDKVVRAAKDIVIKEPVIEELLASDKSALLQYHLAQNPDKVEALNKMTQRELAKAIGRLEATVHLPKAKTATEAPAPLRSPTGGAAAPFQLTPNTSMEDYVAARKAGWNGKG